MAIGSEMMKVPGYQIITANNGIEALTILEDNANDIDLMINNMTMPEMDTETGNN